MSDIIDTPPPLGNWRDSWFLATLLIEKQWSLEVPATTLDHPWAAGFFFHAENHGAVPQEASP